MATSRFISILPATVICVSAALTACNDDFADTAHDSRRFITFEMASNDSFSRSAHDSDQLSTVTLRSGGNQLYLIPEVKATAKLEQDVDTRSRAAQVTKSTIASFGVYAAVSGGDNDAYYMDNVEVTKTDSWTPVEEYLWPGSGSLHLNAYSPYCEAPEGGIVSLPSSNPGDSPVITYRVPDDVTAQTDLMWSTPKDASTSPCLMTFNHALAAVKFVAGSDMTPCTVKSITISGVAQSGRLDIESGQWSDIEGSTAYTATLNTVLSAGEATDVDEGTPITDNEHTFMLLPEQLGDGSSVTIEIDVNGNVSEFTASLSGQKWEAGNTYTYRLSANPDVDRFILTVDSPLSFNYTGGTKSYSVTSRHEKMVNGELTTEEVPWIAEYVDPAGNVIDTPAWIAALPVEGKGSMECEATTRMVEPDFVSMSESTRHLRQQSAVGSESSPYNLANSTGSAAIENTANCYVINAPGSYSLPLVYGNAIKNGANNTAAYLPTRTRTPFVNHLGNHIKSPYIYENSGCTDPLDAILVWEGRLNLVRDVRLSDDGHSILFNIPAASIRQGNAVVAVRDQSGEIMWSWHLWITDYVPGKDLHSMSYEGSKFSMMPLNLGQINGGDETDFASSSALVRFTQKPADGSQGKSVTVTVEQVGKHVITPDCHSFYQWGRKDPMISGIKEWYYADHTEITEIDTRYVETTSGNAVSDQLEAEMIKTPQVFRIYGSSGNPSFSYTNHWNSGTNARPVKTIYDPCPVGFMVPGSCFMAFRDVADNTFSFTPYGGYANPASFAFSATDDLSTVIFPALGYRSGKSGNETVTSNGADMTELWTSHANKTEAVALVLVNDTPITHKLPDDARLEAFGVRPIAE